MNYKKRPKNNTNDENKIAKVAKLNDTTISLDLSINNEHLKASFNNYENLVFNEKFVLFNLESSKKNNQHLSFKEDSVKDDEMDKENIMNHSGAGLSFIPKTFIDSSLPYMESVNGEINISLESSNETQVLDFNSSMIHNKSQFSKNEKEELSIPFTTPVQQIIPLSEFRNIRDNTQNMESELTSVLCTTPVQQIVPLSKFKNIVDDPLTMTGMSITGKKKFHLERSQSEIGLDFNSSLDTRNSSLSSIALKLNRIGNTPETPIDFNISLEEEAFHVHTRKKLPILRSRSGPGFSPLFMALKDRPNATSSPISAYQNPPLTFVEKPKIFLPKIKRITSSRVYEIIKNEFAINSLSYHIIDCRYPYEFDGGHIDGATNLYTIWQLLHYIFCDGELVYRTSFDDINRELTELIDDIVKNKNTRKVKWKNCAFIFHCEFSSIRGPTMARCLREIDMIMNSDSYPELTFPKIFIMDGGYKDLFQKHPDVCQPQQYVRMQEGDVSSARNEEDAEAALEASIEEAERNLGIEGYIHPQVLRNRRQMFSQCHRDAEAQIKALSAYVTANLRWR